MERLNTINEVQRQILNRFKTPREAFRALATGHVTKIKLVTALHHELGISPLDGSELLWLFNEMDTVTEEIWVESFSRISSLFLRLGMTKAVNAFTYSIKNALPTTSPLKASYERVVTKADLVDKLQGTTTPLRPSPNASTTYESASPYFSPRIMSSPMKYVSDGITGRRLFTEPEETV